MNQRLRLYLFWLILCFFGYLWLIGSLMVVDHHQHLFSVCIFKYITQIPCPSCGTTRAVLLMLNGDIVESLSLNPLGVFALSFLAIVPLWIVFDFLFRKDTFHKIYNRFEKSLQKPQYALSFSLLILINWIWNITKNL